MCSKLYDEAETKKPQSIAVFLNFNFLKHQQTYTYQLKSTYQKLIIVHCIVNNRMHILSIDNCCLRNICYIIT